MKRRHLIALAAATTLSTMPQAFAQSAGFPNRPIKLVVPFPAGISPDVVARLIGDKLSAALGQPVLVDNRPGAGGMIGAVAAATSPADGYTLFFSVKASHAIAPNVYRDAKFNPPRDFKAVTQILQVPHVLTATPKAPYNNMKELVAYAKANPGKLNFGSGGNGTLAHLSTEMLRARTGVNIVHVPYKGTSLATNDVMAGHIQVMFDTLSTATPLIKEGKMRAIAVTSAKRSAAFPNVPTIGEAGVKDYVAETWAGLVGPANTPPAVVARLQTAIAKIAANPAIQARLAAGGSEAVGGTSASFASTIKTERVRWAEIVKLSGARATD